MKKLLLTLVLITTISFFASAGPRYRNYGYYRPVRVVEVMRPTYRPVVVVERPRHLRPVVVVRPRVFVPCVVF